MDKTGSGKEWKVVYVYPRHEKKVCSGLLGKGIEAYVPQVRMRKQWSDRKKWVDEVLIKSYVFVRVSGKERDDVLGVGGVVNYLRFNGKDAVVRDSEMEYLQRLVEQGYAVSAEGIEQKKFRRGDKVRIMEGPLKGLEGYVSREDRKTKIEVIIHSIGQVITALIPMELLEINQEEKVYNKI